jgi:ureidoacrylate peracid hydrolase
MGITRRGELRSEVEPQPGDVVAQKYWCSSGFANTDLDSPHTRVEATVRFAAELGYDVTMVRDATADTPS